MSWWTTLQWKMRGASVHPTTRIRPTGSGTVTLGERVWLSRDCEIETETRVEIGPRTTVQRRCTINGTTRVGADCIFAPDVFVSSGTHPFREIAHLTIREQERRLAREGKSVDRPVWIQDDCWIGTHAVVAPGVTIGKGSVIGANSVVTKDVPPYSVVAGIPARVIGQRLEWSPPARVDLAVETDLPYVLSTRDPLVVALRPARDGELLRITLSCTRPTRIDVNGETLDITPATKDLLLAPRDATLRIGFEADAVAFSSFDLVPGA
jgi:acetyltransferase-like isoleucine patch superfamily enzyme